MTVGSWVADWVGNQSTAFRIAGWDGSSDWAVTYDQLAGRVASMARCLDDLGIAHGDRVAFCGFNRLELFETLFACAVQGAIFLPLNNRLTAGELKTQLLDAQPSVVFVTDGLGEVIAAAGAERIRDLDASPVEQGPGVAVDSASVTDHSTLMMVYTSGTTGSPKGAMLSHEAIEFTVANGVDHQQLTADDCIIAPLPTFHVGGLNIQTLPTLRVGGEVILQRRFDPAGVLDLIHRYRPSQTLLVPAMLQAVAAEADFGKVDLSCLVGINTGSSVVPESVVRPYFDRGVPVGQVYGATETGPSSVVLRYEEAAQHPGSCGRAAQHTEVRVVDGEGSELPAGAAGEIWLRGRNLFSGYWQQREATDEVFVDDWYRTGDIGHLDADGYLFVSDRLKDLVISGGENVYPAEVEAVLMEHPAIAEVAVIGRPHDRWGEVPIAYVVRAGPAAPTAAELNTWCEDRLARFKRPHEVIEVSALPRTALGKVTKHVLRAS